MDSVLVDTSTLFDIGRTPRNLKSIWAQNTLYNLGQVSGFTVFEHMVGLHRQGKQTEANEFRAHILPTLEVIYADEAIYVLAAEIYAALAVARKTIGVPDIFIAATAITKGLTLVNTNTKHFPRVQAVGFSLDLQNWREG